MGVGGGEVLRVCATPAAALLVASSFLFFFSFFFLDFFFGNVLLHALCMDGTGEILSPSDGAASQGFFGGILRPNV
mgnify:CR=1 FL=1